MPTGLAWELGLEAEASRNGGTTGLINRQHILRPGLHTLGGRWLEVITRAHGQGVGVKAELAETWIPQVPLALALILRATLTWWEEICNRLPAQMDG